MLARLLASKKSPYIPNWDYRHNLSVDLGVCQLALQLPHGNMYDLPEQLPEPKVNIFDRLKYVTSDHMPEYQQSRMATLLLLSNAWELFGAPLGIQPLGGLLLTAAVVRVDDLPDGFSCTEGAALQDVVDRYIYFTYGPGSVLLEMTEVPIEWKITDDRQWINFIVKDKTDDLSEAEAKQLESESKVIFITPIDPQHFLEFEFIVSGYYMAPATIDYIYGLISSVVDSIEISNREFEFSLEGVDPARELFDWKEHTIGKRQLEDGTYTRVVEPNGSPAPEYRINK
jgi:hypothetical protein